MKSKVLLLLLCITAFASAKTTTLKGKINGALPETLYYTAPVNGALGFNLYYTAKVDAQGNFEIKADLAETSFIDVYYNYQFAGALIAMPGASYSITITESEGKVTHAISGSTITEAQTWYSSVVNNHREAVFLDLAMELAKLETAKAITEEAKTLENRDAVTLKKLYDTKAISNALYTMILKERSYFYSASLGYAFLVKHIYAERETTPPNLTEFDMAWAALYKKHSPADDSISKYPWGYNFLEMYKNYKLYESVRFDGKKILNSQDLLEDRKKNTSFIPAQNAEYYFAAKLYEDAFGDQKEKAVLAEMAYFKEQYPKSGFIAYLEPAIAPIQSFFAENNSLPQGAAYVEDYAAINSLDELIKKFPNQKLYFDVWATWCGPCREEFKHKDALYKLLKANNITVIYVSVDDEKRDETWKKMIPHYGLQGHHIRANAALDNDLKKTFSGGQGISIPWYFLVGSKGEIAVKHAATPSNLEKLEKEIKKL